MINTLKQFVEAFEKSCPKFKDKLTYRMWEEGQAPKLPYVVYYTQKSNNFKADNKVFRKTLHVIVELYTKEKSVKDENYLESFFNSHDIPWSSTEMYLDDEKIYEVYYEIEI